MSTPSAEQIAQTRREIVAVARAILDGRVGVIEGSRRLVGLRWDVDPEQEDRELLGMVGIESQTDHLPLGKWREQWSPDALKAKDAEIAENEEFFRESAYEICRILVERYSGPA